MPQQNPLQSNTRISCPDCGNDIDFFEVADDVVITTHYVQNEDGSFSQQEDNSQVLGQIRLICGECQTDLSAFHDRFSEMVF